MKRLFLKSKADTCGFLLLGLMVIFGWSLAQYLTNQGHVVGGIDNLARRKWVQELGSVSALPIANIENRIAAFHENFGRDLVFSVKGLCSTLTSSVRRYRILNQMPLCIWAKCHRRRTLWWMQLMQPIHNKTTSLAI